jgi:TldD protein
MAKHPFSWPFASRRDFLKISGATLGAAALPPWVLELEAAENAAVNRMKLADVALATARDLGAAYADIRIARYRNESIATRERQVQLVGRDQSFGFGVRVLVKGTWGFASSNQVDEAAVQRVTRQAVEIARANAAFQRRAIELSPVAKVTAEWKSDFETDPFDRPLDTKIQFLLALNETAMAVKGVSFVNSFLAFVNEEKFFASTEDSRIDQYIIRTFPTFNITAVDPARGDFQQRRALEGPSQAGLEYLETHPWREAAQRGAHEAVEKLSARPVEPGEYDLILHPTHLWLTIHESVGHPTELDRAMGWEANFAGTSFLTPEVTGRFQYGSKLVNIFADRTQPSGLATVGYDDDGVPAQRWHLVKEGVFVDWQTTRELAPLVGRATSYGCTHADSWGSVAFPRMPNVSLEPGTAKRSLEELAADVKKGIVIYGDGSFSIDQQRYNFQFGGQTFWAVENGRIDGMLRDVAYQARTPDFWASLDGVGGSETYELGGSFGDGKGEPGQANAVSHGCPVARFRKVNVLNTAAPPRG